MANIDNKKYIITDKERDDRRVARLHDRPNNNGSYGKAGLGPEDVKKAFDAAVDLVVERHNNFVKDVSRQVNEHSDLIGDPNDTGVGDENVYQVFRYAKQAAKTVGKTLGNESDESGADTVYGQAKRVEDAVDQFEQVLGDETDESGADTMYGQAKRAEEAVEQAEKVLGNEDDKYSDNSMHGIYNAALELTLGGESSALGDALLAIIGIQNSYMNGIMPANRVYPVGAIYMSVDPTSPASLFGGEWERLKDRFLLGAGDTYSAGTTGGSADAVVVAHRHLVDMRGGIGSSEITSGYNAILQTGLVKNNSIYTQTSGQDGTGKNMPPYLAVYMWKRIA